MKLGFLGGANGKGSACQCRICKRHGFDPQVRKIYLRRSWQPTPIFLPGESHRQRSLEGHSPWGHKGWDTTEVTQHAHTHTVELQCCVNFCCTAKRLSFIYVYILFNILFHMVYRRMLNIVPFALASSLRIFFLSRAWGKDFYVCMTELLIDRVHEWLF